MTSLLVNSATSQGSACQSKMEAALEARLKKVIEAGPAAIGERLDELDSEWTAGRAAKASVGVVIVSGLALTLLTMNLYWLILPIVGGAVLMQYIIGRKSLIERCPARHI